MDKAFYNDIQAMGEDIVSSSRFAQAQQVPHHSKSGNIAGTAWKRPVYLRKHYQYISV